MPMVTCAIFDAPLLIIRAKPRVSVQAYGKGEGAPTLTRLVKRPA